jgi:hypothetical protein
MKHLGFGALYRACHAVFCLRSGSVASWIPPERISARHISLSKNAGSSNGATSMDRHDYVPIQFERAVKYWDVIKALLGDGCGP